MWANIEDEELVKMFNLTLGRRETIGLDTLLFLLIVVNNRVIWIESDIGLDTCARRRWRVKDEGYEKWRAINPLNGLSV